MGIVDVIIVLSVLCQGMVFWYVGKGRRPYRLMIATYMLYTLVEGWLAWRDPSQRFLWLYVILNVWCATRAYNGLGGYADED